MAEESGKVTNLNAAGEIPPPPRTTVPRIIPKGLAVYYSNCAMVTASHRELSVMFGRVGTADGTPGLAEIYERHIYMTVEQAVDVARSILQAAQKFEEHRKLLKEAQAKAIKAINPEAL
jgi:hypothetical protein